MSPAFGLTSSTTPRGHVELARSSGRSLITRRDGSRRFGFRRRLDRSPARNASSAAPNRDCESSYRPCETLHGGLRAGLGAADDAREIARLIDRLPSNFMRCRGKHACLSAGPPFPLIDQRARRLGRRRTPRGPSTLWMTTPIRPRLTLPSAELLWMSMATSIGIANESPMNPPVRL